MGCLPARTTTVRTITLHGELVCGRAIRRPKRGSQEAEGEGVWKQKAARNYNCRTGESYLGPRPSRKKIDRLCREIGEMTTRKMAGRDVGAQVGRINRKLKGWSNYFRLGTVSKAYRNVNSHVRHRVRQWLSVKFKVQGQGRRRFPDQHLYQKLGLYQLQRT